MARRATRNYVDFCQVTVPLEHAGVSATKRTTLMKINLGEYLPELGYQAIAGAEYYIFVILDPSLPNVLHEKSSTQARSRRARKQPKMPAGFEIDGY